MSNERFYSVIMMRKSDHTQPILWGVCHANRCRAQDEKIRALENKIRPVVGGCSTLKQLRDALPEFVKYMPTEQEPLSKNLPALANVVADFKAAGFKFTKNTEGAV